MRLQSYYSYRSPALRPSASEVNMIVCVVDDLIFSIKISTAAKQLGVPMYFERSKASVLQTIRDKQPSLVIFDLNSGRLAPIEAIVAMKSDAALRSIRTLGYVAHVDSETIERARAAGIDQVMARSAFSEKLGDILTGPGTRDPGSGAPNA